MGGAGSGRRSAGTSTTDDLVGLDVRSCERAGILRPGYVGRRDWLRGDRVVATIDIRALDDRIILAHRTRVPGGEWEDHRYPVRIVRTRCRYGGSRRWFLCPRIGCGRRVAILYGAETFACRRCCGLSYASRLESHPDQFSRRADAIRAQLGWEPGCLNGHGGKPKGMHQATFRKLCALHDRLVSRAVGAFSGADWTKPESDSD